MKALMEIIRLSDRPDLKDQAAQWFSSKWSVPKEAYLESIEASFSAVVPTWYVCLDGEKIIAGMGVIENDFHDRKDLTPNVCAVFTEEEYRCQGIAGRLLDFVCRDMAEKGIETLYLLTDHTSFYERYGWHFHCLAMGDGEDKPSRMYIHQTACDDKKQIRCMNEKTFPTPFGTIHYWTNDIDAARRTLVFLPGLTADHRLFDKQVEHFSDEYNVLVWDAPGHAASRPFRLEFSLKDKAEWLHGMLAKEGISKPILVGQSMGGYVSQAFMQYFPGEAAGFVSIDSSTLIKKYYPKWEIKVLYHTEGMYRIYPWKWLVKQGANGTAESEYGRKLMTEIMEVYADNPRYYASLVGHGYRMLADAINADLPYAIDCPCLLICGEKDKAGDTRRFNRKWASGEALPIVWIPDAGHNSNTDAPERVNALIETFVDELL